MAQEKRIDGLKAAAQELGRKIGSSTVSGACRVQIPTALRDAPRIYICHNGKELKKKSETNILLSIF